MAQRKSDQAERPAESSPNPHAEQHTAHEIVKTDQSGPTGRQNIAQTPSTTHGRLHPSVAEGVEGAAFDDDSMFNSADSQTRPEPSKRSPPDSAQKSKGTPNPAKHRKIA